jgi:adenosine deaminase
LQTDDKGVFSTTLSAEYAIAAATFDLSRQDVWDLSYASIDHIFADDSVKQTLRAAWQQSKSDLLST